SSRSAPESTRGSANDSPHNSSAWLNYSKAAQCPAVHQCDSLFSQGSSHIDRTQKSCMGTAIGILDGRLTLTRCSATFVRHTHRSTLRLCERRAQGTLVTAAPPTHTLF